MEQVPEKEEKLKEPGRLYAITGPMFSGKSTELLRYYRMFRLQGVNCQMFSSALDTRYSATGDVSTHDGDHEPSLQVSTASEISAAIKDETGAIFIDEIHLIKGDIPYLCWDLCRDGKVVFVSGLDLDFLGNPFPDMQKIMAEADAVIKKAGTCARCGAKSRYSFRIVDSKEKLLVGGTDAYEPRCRNCFTRPDLD